MPDAGCVPSAEVCDGVDNNCDGQTDEGLLIACNTDDDGDGYATSSTVLQLCPDPTRPAAGQCPVAFVSPTTSLGLDCDPVNAALSRTLPARSDLDGDGACVGPIGQDCVLTLAAGRRDPSSCSATDDCDDTNAATYRLAQTRADADNDAYCAGTAASTCVGAVAPAGRRLSSSCMSSDDCDDSNAALYQLAQTRADADNDVYCVGTATSTCIGMMPPAGRRLASSCMSTDDCNDANASAYQVVSTRADADNDTFCVGAAANTCIGSTPPAGRRLATTCNVSLGDDCNDADATKFTNVAFIVDADGDRYCSGVVVTQCAGNTAPAGLQFPANCILQTDCNDTNASIYQLLSVRLDADNDGYCLGSATNQCSGATPPSGFRLPSTCYAVDDCRDTNPLAGATCVLIGAYTTTSATKTCVFVPPTESFTVSTTNICPLGFTLGTYAANKLPGSLSGSCTATSPTSLSMTCNGLDGAICNIVGNCNAL